VAILLVQTALLCGCGSAELEHGDMCKRCRRRARLSDEKFAGLREFVLARDEHSCQACGEPDERRLLVHHRRHPAKQARWLITLCRMCHVRIHHVRRPSCAFVSVALLRALWREQHPRQAEQLLLAQIADDGETQQVELFADSAA
jgi:hypothetical protein